ncbi:hypothetical protein B9G53_11740 [Pseudanabaena sp. SR411]|nr:hypothetical protein B9G53_11740 [Pseudanabaena sp. SR411]
MEARSASTHLLAFLTAICCLAFLTVITDQTNYKKFSERIAKQSFQKISWLGFGRKSLYGAENNISVCYTIPTSSYKSLIICCIKHYGSEERHTRSRYS